MATTEVAALVESAKCFTCLSEDDQIAVQTYLLAVSVGGSLDPATLLEAAKCFRCMSQKDLLAIQAYLLCQLNNA